MTGIFVSYRREDAAGHAGRLFDRLRARFGQSVFMDVSGIEPGVDFVEAIERAVGSCDVLLAVIGREWLGCRDVSGRRRLEDPNDFIRIEVARALGQGVRVVPVLVEGATMPPPDALPPDLQALSRRQAAELRDTRWDADVDDLIERLANVRPPRRAVVAPPKPAGTPGTRRARWPWVVGAACLVLGVVIAFVMARAPYPQPSPQPAMPAPASGLRPSYPGKVRPDGATDAVRPPEVTAPAMRRMEVLIGMPLDHARTTLTAAGLETRVTYEETREARPDTVLRQEPGPDAVIPDDLRVAVLTVAREPAAGIAVKGRPGRGRVGEPTLAPRLVLGEVPAGPPLHIDYAEDADEPATQQLEEALRRSGVPLSGIFRERGAISHPGTLFYENEQHRDLAARVAQQSRGFLSRLYGHDVGIEVRHNPSIPQGSLVLHFPPREPVGR